MELPKEFYTPATLFTLTGMATAVWFMTCVIGYLVRIGVETRKWVGFVLSLFFALLGASLLQDKTLVTWVVATVNGFLIYLTAVGVNTVSAPSATQGAASPVKETAAVIERKRRSFLARWW